MGEITKYLTPDAQTGDSTWLLFKVPQNSGHVALFVGALAALTNEWNFEKDGTERPADTAEAFSRIISNMLYYHPPEVGTFVYSLRETAPPNWIICQGQDLPMADWPELMAVYPNVLKNYPSAGRFYVPNNQGRVLVGDGVDAFGYNWQFLGQGGSRTHTLTTAEMPAHTHGEGVAVPAIINGGLEAPASAATAASGVTGSAGGGQAHNNMPPYGVCHVYIVGRILP